MNVTLILRFLGFINFFIAAAMLLPLPFAYYYKGDDISALLISSAINLVLGGILLLVTRNKPKKDVRSREGFLIVTLGWLIFAAFGALPFYISGCIPSYTDAFFETMSGFTTTGATILTDIEALPKGLLFWRSLTHWFGGMGIILLSIAILPFLGIGGMQLFKAEVPGPVADKVHPRVTETAKILWGVYMLITAIETVLLMFGGMDLFDALCHSFGTLATGGYSTKNASVAHYNSAYIDYVITIFMILAGTNFALHYGLLKGDIKGLIKNAEWRFFIFLILGASALIGIDVFINTYDGNFWDTLRFTSFQVTSIVTTTGYGTADYEQWSITSQLILLVLMFVGGSAGSTGGGMKVMRVLLLLKFAQTELKRLIHPNAVIPLRIGGTVIDRKVMMNILGFFLFFMLLSVVGTLALSLFPGIDIPTAIGATVATLNNIGPGLSQVGPTDNYAFFHPIAKWILSGFMLLGRLEVFTVLILLTPAFWKK
jgi:trk system potassium uptake protein TrkH